MTRRLSYNTCYLFQLFILSSDVVASLVELPALDLPGGGVTAGLTTADRQVRVLLRDLSGKACWDASILYCSPEMCPCRIEREEKRIETRESNSFVQPESMMIEGFSPVLPQRAMRHRPPNVLPDVGNAAPDLDQLDDVSFVAFTAFSNCTHNIFMQLLQYLSHTSPECLENCDRKLNEPTPPPITSDLEQEAIASVISQRNSELDHNRLTQNSLCQQPASRPNSRSAGIIGNDCELQQGSSLEIIEQAAFQKCRLLFSQLGLPGWEKRHQVHLLDKTERLLRELRNLDTQCCRETHKVQLWFFRPFS